MHTDARNKMAQEKENEILCTCFSYNFYIDSFNASPTHVVVKDVFNGRIFEVEKI